MPTAPPEVIDCPRGVLTRLREQDVAGFLEVVAANADHLGGWIPWAVDPALGRQRLQTALVEWEHHSAYFYALREHPDAPVAGGFSLHRRVGADGLEIGYWLAASHTGRGLATEVAGVLTRVALAQPGIDRVEIHTDEGNLVSAAVPHRLGYRLARVDDVEARTACETGRLQIWVTP